MLFSCIFIYWFVVSSASYMCTLYMSKILYCIVDTTEHWLHSYQINAVLFLFSEHSFLTPTCYTCKHVFALTNLLDRYTCLCSYQFVLHVHVFAHSNLFSCTRVFAHTNLLYMHTCLSHTNLLYMYTCLCSHHYVIHVLYTSLLTQTYDTRKRVFCYTNLFLCTFLCSHQFVLHIHVSFLIPIRFSCTSLCSPNCLHVHVSYLILMVFT